MGKATKTIEIVKTIEEVPEATTSTLLDSMLDRTGRAIRKLRPLHKKILAELRARRKSGEMRVGSWYQECGKPACTMGVAYWVAGQSAGQWSENYEDVALDDGMAWTAEVLELPEGMLMKDGPCDGTIDLMVGHVIGANDTDDSDYNPITDDEGNRLLGEDGERISNYEHAANKLEELFIAAADYEAEHGGREE